jgi:hypothetical protein
MREYILCPKCFRAKMQVCQVVERGTTLKLECPNCGALDYIPVWGKRHSPPVTKGQGEVGAFLTMIQSSDRLKSLSPKHKRRF